MTWRRTSNSKKIWAFKGALTMRTMMKAMRMTTRAYLPRGVLKVSDAR